MHIVYTHISRYVRGGVLLFLLFLLNPLNRYVQFFFLVGCHRHHFLWFTTCTCRRSYRCCGSGRTSRSNNATMMNTMIVIIIIIIIITISVRTMLLPLLLYDAVVVGASLILSLLLAALVLVLVLFEQEEDSKTIDWKNNDESTLESWMGVLLLGLLLVYCCYCNHL